MGRRQVFLLLLVLCVFASFVSAQSSSVEFLDEWGEATSRILNQGRTLLRVIDPAADTTPGRDSVAVALSSVNGEDEATAHLTESGGATGVFEGAAFLTTDYGLDNIYGVDADQLYTTWVYNPDPTLDTATATYGAASASAEVGLSEARFVDAEGRGTDYVVAGAPVHVRVRDAYEDNSAGPDFTTATLTTSDGDSEVVTLTENGARTRTYLGSLPVVLGTPVTGDGRIQSGHGQTITVTHAEEATGTTASSDTATVVGALVSFLRTRDGRTARTLLADSPIGMRLIDASLNLDPVAVESRGVSITMMTVGDAEYTVLRETGPDTGVFEGTIQHVTTTYQASANGFLESPAGPDTVRLQHEAAYYASIEAPLIVSTTRLVDEAGEDSESVAFGAELRVEVENAMDTDPFLDVWSVQVRSLATNDLETLQVAETDGRSYLFTGAIPVVPGTAVSGDGRVQAQAGETVEVVTDVGGTTSSDQAAVVRSSVRFVDGSGQPASVLLEESDARVRVLDLLSAGQAPPAAGIQSKMTGDLEPLGLAELPASPGLFEGSIPTTAMGWASGILPTGRALNEADTVTALTDFASASVPVLPAVIEVLNGPAAAGDTLSLRVTAPRADVNPYPEYLMVLVSSLEYGHSQYVFLAETGGSTGIFEGTVPAVLPGDSAPAPLVYVEATDTVEIVYNAAIYSGDPTGRVTGIVDIVPVSVQFVDDQGEVTAGYLFGEYVRVRVAEPAANADPDTAESVEAILSARRYGDAKVDVETATLVETGPDTGVFMGSLSTGVLAGFNDLPAPYNAVLEFPDYLAAPDNVSTITASRGGVSATARVRDSEIRLLDDQGQDADSFLVGETFQVRMRRPLTNATPGVDTETVGVQARVDTGYRDSLMLTLTETGGDTGVFTAMVTTAEPPVDFLDSVVQAVPGDLLFVQRSNYLLYSFDTAVFTGEGGGEPINQQPDAVDDAVTTNEDTPVIVEVAFNDTDPDDDTLEVFQVWPASPGTAVLNPDGTVTYTPPAGFSGTALFMYAVRDGAAGTPYLTDTATVFVTVNSVNDPPNAVNDSAVTNEDTPVNVAVKANDSDPDGEPFAVTSVTLGLNGFTAVEANGTITYMPNLNFFGTDAFTYTLSDGNGGTDTATVTVMVNGVNDPPVAVDDSATTIEDTAVFIPVLANDSDPDNAFTITAVTQGAKGAAVVQGDGTIRYAPSANANGSDSFTYTISDGSATDTATVAVTIAPVNDAPVAWNDSVTTPEDTAITIAILANDVDVDVDPLTASNVGAVANGTLVLNPNGTLTYTPNPDFRGFENFTYKASDPSGANSTATVHIEVTPVNDPPTAVNDAVTTNEDTPLNFDVASNDTDPDGDNLVVSAVTQGTKGSVVINNSPSLNGKYVIYTPNPNANGSDSFTYTVSDGHSGTSTATVSMTITPVNDAPDAVADSITTAEDTPVTFNPRANDTDADGDTLTITSVNGGTRGTPLLNGNGTITYTPNANSTGTDFFQVHISDGNGGTDSALATITITPVNDAPNANNDLPITNEDTAVTVNVLSNDVDVEGNTLTVTSLTQPAKGTAVLNPDKTITYTPNLNTNGSDSFTYTISDGNGGSDTATVSITVVPVNDPPVANADSVTVPEDAGVAFQPMANDTDAEGGTLTIVAVTQSANGSASISGTFLSFSPAANFHGTTSFTYTIRDTGGLESTATVTVTVTPVNDPPVAGTDGAATNEDTPVVIPVLANDTDIDGGALSVSAVTQGANGAVTSNGSTVTYTPAANWSGGDSFTYTVSDGAGGTATATVIVSIAAVNDAPNAAPDSGSTREGVAVIVPVLANDTDVDGGTLTVTAMGAPGVLLPDGTVQYTPGANFTGTATFSCTVSDGQGGTSNGQVTVVVGEALERVAVLATNSVWLRSGSDVLSGDVIVNQASAGPYLNGAELSVGGAVTTPANWDVEADSLTTAAGAVVGGDVSYNQLTNNGTINGLQRSPLALPVFSTLPAFLAATPGTTTITVANNGTRTLAPGSYLDLVVGRKGTVTFTGGVYHFRSITVDREAKLLFSAASEVRVQQKLSTKTLTTVGPATGASIDASSILFYVAGINGTTGALAATPKAVEIGTSNTVAINLYAPNGTIWLQDTSQATGAFLGKDIDVGLNVQVTLDSAWQ